jgi:hypothetical protein
MTDAKKKLGGLSWVSSDIGRTTDAREQRHERGRAQFNEAGKL